MLLKFLSLCSTFFLSFSIFSFFVRNLTYSSVPSVFSLTDSLSSSLSLALFLFLSTVCYFLVTFHRCVLSFFSTLRSLLHNPFSLLVSLLISVTLFFSILLFFSSPFLFHCIPIFCSLLSYTFKLSYHFILLIFFSLSKLYSSLALSPCEIFIFFHSVSFHNFLSLF